MYQGLPILIVFAVTLLSHAQEATPPSAFDQVERTIRIEAERIKQQLLDTHASTNYDRLLKARVTVDSSLIPAWLLEDAAAFCLAASEGREPPDLLRLMRAEYGGAPVLSEWSHPDGIQRAARSIAAWAGCGRGRAACHAYTASMQSSGGDSPPFIRWTVSNDQQDRASRIDAYAHWYEPCLETTHLDWPLTPHGLHAFWDDAGGTIETHAGKRHSEAWGAHPIFNNPTDVYAIHDALRARRCIDMQVMARTAVHPADAIGTDDRQDIRIRTIRRTDGSVVRTERWEYMNDALVQVIIEQPALRLVAHTPESFEIRSEVAGELLDDPEIYHPHTTRAYPLGGMRIEIAFRAADDSRDALPALSGTTVPSEARVLVGGKLVARVGFMGFAVEGGAPDAARVTDALAAWQAAAREGAANRARSAAAVTEACASGDIARLSKECEYLGNLAVIDGVPSDWAVANVAIVRRRLAEHAFEQAALEFTAPVIHGDEFSGFRAPGASTLPPHREALYAAIRSGLQSFASAPGVDAWLTAQTVGASPKPHARMRTTIAAFERAALHALHTAPESDERLGDAIEQLTSRTAHDIRCLISHGIDEFAASADGENDASILARSAQFSTRVHRMLEQQNLRDGEQSVSHADLLRAAGAAQDVTRSLAKEWGVAPAETDELCAQVRASIVELACLANNAWEPEFFGGWVAHATRTEFAECLRHAMHTTGMFGSIESVRKFPDAAVHVRRALSTTIPGAMRGVLISPTPPGQHTPEER